MGSPEKYEICLTVPLTTEREAQICYDVLRVDSEPPRSRVIKVLEYNEKALCIKLSSADVRQLRVSLTSLMDHLQLVVQTLHQFGPPVSENYNFYTGSSVL